MNDFAGKHAQNAEHGESSILNFDIQESELLGTLVIEGDTKVSRPKISRFLILPGFHQDFVEANRDGHLDPTGEGNDREGGETVGDFRKFQILAGTAKAFEPKIFLRQHAQGRRHGDPTVLELHTAVVQKIVLLRTVRTASQETEGTVKMCALERENLPQRLSSAS